MDKDTARAMQTLIDAHAELEARQAAAKAAGTPYFDVTDDKPLMTVTIDSRTGVLEYPKAVHLAEAVSRRGRQMGMKLRVIVRDPQRCWNELGGSAYLRGTAELVKG